MGGSRRSALACFDSTGVVVQANPPVLAALASHSSLYLAKLPTPKMLATLCVVLAASNADPDRRLSDVTITNEDGVFTVNGVDVFGSMNQPSPSLQEELALLREQMANLTITIIKVLPTGMRILCWMFVSFQEGRCQRSSKDWFNYAIRGVGRTTRVIK